MDDNNCDFFKLTSSKFDEIVFPIQNLTLDLKEIDLKSIIAIRNYRDNTSYTSCSKNNLRPFHSLIITFKQSTCIIGFLYE